MQNPRILATLLATLVFFGLCPAAAPAETNRQFQHWTASWIVCPGAPVRDAGVFHFRKRITLASVPAHFLVHVSGDAQFLFFVNQQHVGTGPARGDLAHWRYETYDLAPFLRAGSNLLAATVWNFGQHSAIAQMSDRAGFLLQGDSSAEQLADTNDTWEAEQENAITATAPAS